MPRSDFGVLENVQAITKQIIRRSS